MKELKNKTFTNGAVYLLETEDSYPIEVTDTFLPFYTKDAIGRKQNKLDTYELGSRADRWMIGVSCMSGCPVRCKFCATGLLPKWRNLSSEEIVEQVSFILNKNSSLDPKNSKEFKINYTRMGEPFLNLAEIKKAVLAINTKWPFVHHYISTIGISKSDLSWIKDNITLQVSLHSLDEKRRNELIPFKGKMSISELGGIRTASALQTTLNLTLVSEDDFDITKLKENFDPTRFFVKLSPINPNPMTEDLGSGIIDGVNLQ